MNYFRHTPLAFFLALYFFLYLSHASRGQNVDWAIKMGSSGTNDIGQDVVCNASGDVYSCGLFFGSAQFGTYTLTSTSGSATYVTKTNASGNVLWALRFSGTTNLYAQSITCDEAGDIYVMGQFGGTSTFGSYTLTSVSAYDCYIAKVSPNGTVLWAKQIGGSAHSGMFFSLASDHSGKLYASGYFSGTGIFGATTLTTSDYMNAFVMKMDQQSGSVVWAKQMGAGTMYATANAVTTDYDGNVYIGGIFQGGGTFGIQTLASAGGEDMFIAKLEPLAGNVSWVKQWGGISGDALSSLATDAAGDVYFTGSFYETVAFDAFNLVSAGHSDIVTAKVNSSNGAIVWAKQWGGSVNVDSGQSIEIDSKGNLYVCGYYADSAVFDQYASGTMAGENIFVVKVDRLSGAVEWLRQMGGPSDERGNGLACDGLGNVYVTGIFGNYSSMFGSVALAPYGGLDAYLVKIHDVIAGYENFSFAESLSVGPNPFVNEIAIMSTERGLDVSVYDSFGRRVYEAGNVESRATLDLSSLSPGLYHLRIHAKDGSVAVKKMIKN